MWIKKKNLTVALVAKMGRSVLRPYEKSPLRKAAATEARD
jgi:hypothetical protein